MTSNGSWHRQVALEVAALRTERQQESSSGGSAVSECRSELRELAAVAGQVEQWLAIMRAANRSIRSGATQADDT